eukprot:TRINITY_DN121110_c0_g1_i1.p1 TRINITY_DN121110_c0_g1~~TRINITY_DN121110_c0_g1_i1.p1  ORF type:complete len:911 (+),score=208.81 TRINITY_DN121110_c0_g1_i1:109-2841(+)
MRFAAPSGPPAASTSAPLPVAAKDAKMGASNDDANAAAEATKRTRSVTPTGLRRPTPVRDRPPWGGGSGRSPRRETQQEPAVAAGPKAGGSSAKRSTTPVRNSSHGRRAGEAEDAIEVIEALETADADQAAAVIETPPSMDRPEPEMLPPLQKPQQAEEEELVPKSAAATAAGLQQGGYAARAERRQAPAVRTRTPPPLQPTISPTSAADTISTEAFEEASPAPRAAASTAPAGGLVARIFAESPPRQRDEASRTDAAATLTPPRRARSTTVLPGEPQSQPRPARQASPVRQTNPYMSANSGSGAVGAGSNGGSTLHSQVAAAAAAYRREIEEREARRSSSILATAAPLLQKEILANKKDEPFPQPKATPVPPPPLIPRGALSHGKPRIWDEEYYCQEWEAWAQAVVRAVEEAQEPPEPPRPPSASAADCHGLPIPFVRVLEASTVAAAALARSSAETEGLRLVAKSLDAELARSRADIRRLQDTLNELSEERAKAESKLNGRCEELQSTSKTKDDEVRRLRRKNGDLQAALDAEKNLRKQAEDARGCLERQVDSTQTQLQDSEALRRKELEDAWHTAETSESKHRHTLAVLRDLLTAHSACGAGIDETGFSSASTAATADATPRRSWQEDAGVCRGDVATASRRSSAPPAWYAEQQEPQHLAQSLPPQPVYHTPSISYAAPVTQAPANRRCSDTDVQDHTRSLRQRAEETLRRLREHHQSTGEDSHYESPSAILDDHWRDAVSQEEAEITHEDEDEQRFLEACQQEFRRQREAAGGFKDAQRRASAPEAGVAMEALVDRATATASRNRSHSQGQVIGENGLQPDKDSMFKWPQHEDSVTSRLSSTADASFEQPCGSTLSQTTPTSRSTPTGSRRGSLRRGSSASYGDATRLSAAFRDRGILVPPEREHS